MNSRYEAQDWVSVWVGTFPNQAAFDTYFAEVAGDDEDDSLSCPFWQDLGIGQTDPDFQEADFLSLSTDVAVLLSGFSWVETYRDAVLQRCQERGIVSANAAVLRFEYAYFADAPFSSDYLVYLGAFPYATGGSPLRRG